MIILIFILIFLIILNIVKKGQFEMIEYPYYELEIKKETEFDKFFKGIYITEKKTPHLWKWEDKILYCKTNLFLPFARFNVPLKKIDEAFNNLKKIEPNVYHKPFTINKINFRTSINNNYYAIIYPKESAQICVDYFQEEVRMSAYRRSKISHWQFYKRKYGLVYGQSDYNKYIKQQDELWQSMYSCTEIPPEILVLLVKFLRKQNYKIESILDMSAGRGSRLTAAIALDGIN